MPLKIIGAGYGRTGTLSVYTALNQLGFPCYHMAEVLKNRANRHHLDFWHRVARSQPGLQQDWEQVFSRYTATQDNPACCVWRELMAAFPDAKIVLTVHPRGAEAWYESTLDTIYFTENTWQFKVLEWLTPFGRKFGDMSRRLIWQRSHGGTMENREAAIARYHAHVQDVKAAVPPDRLLVFSADQGWKPLCDFLGVPVPDTPFPSVNDRVSMMKMLGVMKLVAYVLLLAVAAAIAGIGYGLWLWLR